MKSQKIPDILPPNDLTVRQSSRSLEKTGNFQTMLDAVQSVQADGLSKSGIPGESSKLALLRSSTGQPGTHTGSVSTGYDSNRSYPLTGSEKLNPTKSISVPQNALKEYRGITARGGEDSDRVRGRAFKSSGNTNDFHSFIRKIVNFFSRIFSGHEPDQDTAKASQEASENTRSSVGFLEGLGSYLTSGKWGHSVENELQANIDASVAEANGWSRNEAIFARTSGQFLPTHASVDEVSSKDQQDKAETRQQFVPLFAQSVRRSMEKQGISADRNSRRRQKLNVNSKLDGHQGLTKRIERVIIDSAVRYDLPPNLIAAVINVESGFSPRAVSSRGARGLMQLMPATAAQLQVKNSFDIEQNIDGGCRYLKYLLNEFDGRLHLALAAYNAGPGAVKKHGGVPPYDETKHFVRKVLAYL